VTLGRMLYIFRILGWIGRDRNALKIVLKIVLDDNLRKEALPC